MFSYKHKGLSLSLILALQCPLFTVYAQTTKTRAPNTAGKSYSMENASQSQTTTKTTMALTGNVAPEACSQKIHKFSFTIANLQPGNADCKAAMSEIARDPARLNSTVVQTKCTINYYMTTCQGKASDFAALDEANKTKSASSSNSNGTGAMMAGAAALAALPAVKPVIDYVMDKKGSGAASDGIAGTTTNAATNSNGINQQSPQQMGDLKSSGVDTNKLAVTSENQWGSNNTMGSASTSTGGSATSSGGGNGFQQSDPSQMGNMQSGGVDTNKLGTTSDSQWSTNNPASAGSNASSNSAASGGSGGSGLHVPAGVTPDQVKQLESLTGNFNQQAYEEIRGATRILEQAAETVNRSDISGSINSLPESYEEASRSCGSAADRAETWCIEEKSPGVKTAMSALSAGLPMVQAAVGAHDQCSKANQMIDLVSKGVTLAQGTCAALKATCDMTCARVSKKITTIGNELLRASQQITQTAQQMAASEPLNPQPPQAISLVTQAGAKIKAFMAAEYKPENTDAVAARIAKCGAYTQTLVQTGAGLLSMMMANKTIKDCKEKTQASNNTDKCSQLIYQNTAECIAKNDLAKKCALAEFADTTECYCYKNPGVSTCSGLTIAGLNMDGGLQKMTNGNSATGSGAAGDLGGGLNLGSNNPIKNAARDPAAMGAGGSAGGGGFGGGVGGGSGTTPSAESGADGTAAAALSSGLEGIGGGFSLNRGNRSAVNEAKQALRDGRNQPGRRSIASENGVTGPVGKSLWEKVRQTYSTTSSTLIDQ